ncbi:MAG: SDR family oxidoreductase [Corynebacteriales bacterium]|nr:SDR family oxidoreductase [Mycobacteriales bacterium]
MRVVIAGGHGKIALKLESLLFAREDEPVGLIRNPAHATEVEAMGAQAVVCDLERADVSQVAEVLRGADAVVFAAGAGAGSGVERKYAVDRDGSILLAKACEQVGVRRFVQISSMGAGQPPQAGSNEVWSAYINAKTEAEDDLRSRGLNWTIVRPGRLTDDEGTGLVHLSQSPVSAAEVSRDDVAAVVAELLGVSATSGMTLELTGGDIPVREAVQRIAAG